MEAEPDHLPGEGLRVDGVLGAEGDEPRLHAEVESGMEDRLSPGGWRVHRLISQSEDQAQLFAKRGALFGAEQEARSSVSKIEASLLLAATFAVGARSITDA